MRHTVALLLFAQNSKRDAFRKKNLWNSTVRQTTTVFQSLTKRVLQTAKATQLPFFLSSDLCNASDSFGRQLTTSVQAIFAKGYKSVICIGNDCPQLTSELLQKTALQLQNGQSVVGPDSRGGVYLVGIQNEEFQAEAFEKLPWQTADLRESLGQMLGNKTQMLPVFADINAEIDLHHWAKRDKTYQQLLLSLLDWLFPVVVSQPTFILSFSPTSNRLRPPPALLP